MRKANIIKVTNEGKKIAVLYAKDRLSPDDFVLVCHPGHWMMKDFFNSQLKYEIDIDECYFQFLHLKRKISIENAAKYGIFLEYEYHERKSSQNYNVSNLSTFAYAIEVDVHVDE